MVSLELNYMSSRQGKTQSINQYLFLVNIPSSIVQLLLFQDQYDFLIFMSLVVFRVFVFQK